MVPYRIPSAALLTALLLLFTTPPTAAAPSVASALASWDGPRQLLLRTDRPDPLADPAVQGLLAQGLAAGYQVRLGAPDTTAESGLVADLRTGSTGDVIALSTADGVVLAFEAPPATVAEAPPSGTRTDSAPAASAGRWPAGPLPLTPPARRIAVLGGAEGSLHLAALLDDAVQELRISADGIRYGARHPSGSSPSRGLYLGSSPPAGGSRTLVAASWAEDISDIYAGTDSRLHGWILGWTDSGWEPLGPDLRTHLRMVGGRVYSQTRGPHLPFSGLVTRTGPGADPEPVVWAQRDLYAFTPLDDGRGLAWDERGQLLLVDNQGGAPRPGGLLMDDLGPLRGPTFAVRLEEPEYRLGLEKEARVTERRVPLPPRLVPVGRDAAYTIRRGRRQGLPLLGRPTGSDEVVRVRVDTGALRLEHVFPPVDAFVLDFALVPAANGPETVVLLINERGDGEGRSFLLVQTKH